MARLEVSAPDATAVGPYSHGVFAGEGSSRLLFLSGQTPFDAAPGQLATGPIDAQTKQCLENLRAVLEAANLTFDDVVKCNVFLTDMADFAAMNEAYARYFKQPYPARTTIGVVALPLGAKVEIEMVAKAAC